MEEQSNTTVEWNIENFSYWRLELHEKCISSSSLPFLSGNSMEVELYPRGLEGNEEYLMLRFMDAKFNFYGDLSLSFIGSDGSVICMKQVDYADHRELFTGPKFMDVVAQIKKNEESHKDRLKLRFHFHQSNEDFEHLIMSTTIDIRKISLKIDQELIENIEPASVPKCVFRNKDLIIKTALDGETVKFMLKPHDEVNQCVLVETCISMVSSDNTLVRREEQSHVFLYKEKISSWTFSDSLQTKVIKERGITVILRLVVIQHDMIKSVSSKFYYDKRVRVQNEQKSYRNFVPVFSTADSVDVLPKDFMCLYQDQDFSDFQLKCGTVSFPVHRAILSARSPVLKTMFLCNMKESTSREVEIEDLDAPTIARFLVFLYAGALEDLQGESALKLYYAADKYQVPTLKKECVDYLSANLSISNVCDVLSLADKHQDEDLTTVSRDFVLDNYNEVLRSKEWESFIVGESSLALKIVTYFAAKDRVVKKQEHPKEHPKPQVFYAPSQVFRAAPTSGFNFG